MRCLILLVCIVSVVAGDYKCEPIQEDKGITFNYVNRPSRKISTTEDISSKQECYDKCCQLNKGKFPDKLLMVRDH